MLTRKFLRVPLGAVVAGLLLSAGFSGEAEAGDRGRYHGYHNYYSGPLFGLFFGYPGYERKRDHKHRYSYRPHRRHHYYTYRDDHYRYRGRHFRHGHPGHKFGHRGHRYRH